MSETPTETTHEKRLRRFLVLRLLGPKTDQWHRFYQESEGNVRRKPDIVLTEDQLAAEMDVFRRELLSVGTWPVALIAVVTLIVSVAGLMFKGWLVALLVAIAGALVAVVALGAIRGRNQRLWQEFQRRCTVTD